MTQINKMDQVVLVINTRDIKKLHSEILTYNSAYDEYTIASSEEGNGAFWTVRGPAESNPDIVQIIPYCYITDGQNFLIYKRTTNGGEKRLHNKISIGVGGHINEHPQRENLHKKIVYLNQEAYRELQEEVGLFPHEIKEFNYCYQIYITEPDVCKYHLGLVFKVTVSYETLINLSFRQNDGEVIPTFVSTMGLKNIFHDASLSSDKEKTYDVEDWSKIVIDRILN